MDAGLARLELPSPIMGMLKDYLKNPKHMLLFHGSPGIGKTYFCAALIEWAFTYFNSVRFHNEKKLLSTLRQKISDGYGDYGRNLEMMIDDDIVILDDVGSGINPHQVSYKDLEWRREIFFHFLDYRYHSKMPTIITSNFKKSEFESVYSERIMSRLFAKENTVIGLFGSDGQLDKRSRGM